MKTKFAAVFAALTAVATNAPVFAATDPGNGGHYEWRHVLQPGPNKSNLPSYRRVWVADTAPTVAMEQGSCMAMACCNASKAKA